MATADADPASAGVIRTPDQRVRVFVSSAVSLRFADMLEPVPRQHLPQPRSLLAENDEVEILAHTRLLAHQSIHVPAAVQPNVHIRDKRLFRALNV